MSESHLDLWWETAANTQQDRQAEPFYAKYVDTHTTGVCLEWEFYFYYRFLIFHRSSFYTDILSGWLYYNYFCTNIFTTIDRLWNVNEHVVSETPWVHPKDRRCFQRKLKTPSPCRPPTTQWKQTPFSDCVPSNVRLQPSILAVGPSHRGNYMKEEKNRARRTEQFYLFSHFQHTTDLLICLFFFLFPSQILFLFFAFLALFPAFTLLWNSLEPRLVSLYLASFIPTLVLSNRFLNIFQSFSPSSGWFLTNFHSLARFQWKGGCHEAILKERKQEKRAKLC